MLLFVLLCALYLGAIVYLALAAVPREPQAGDPALEQLCQVLYELREEGAS